MLIIVKRIGERVEFQRDEITTDPDRQGKVVFSTTYPELVDEVVDDLAKRETAGDPV